MSDLVERLRKAGGHLGDAIAGYRDENFRRSAKGLTEMAALVLDAAEEIERLRAALQALLDEWARGRDGIQADTVTAARRALEEKPR